MKIRTRLQVSNFLMILVPMAMTLATGVLCVALLWLAMSVGGGLGFDDKEDLDEASARIMQAVAQAMEVDEEATRFSRLERLTALLDDNAMRLVVTEDGKDYYHYGAESEDDAALAKAAEVLEGGGSISRSDRTLYVEDVSAHGDKYRIALYGSEQNLGTGFVEMLLVMVAVILVAVILIALLVTNHFLTRFVIRKIEEPLDILARGVQEIGAGNLDYRIVYDGDDEFAPICAEFNDMALRLKRSVEETQRQEENRKEVMAGISHDLRSPLTAIQAYVEGLLDGVANTPEKQQAYLRTIKTKAEEIQHMVSQIFQFSKMDLENYPVTVERLALDEEVGALLEVVAPEYAAKGLEVEADLSPVAVEGDAELIRRMVVNILDNSLKYKSAATGHALVQVREKDEGAMLTIADDGPGVPEEALPKLFDVFYRSDPSRHNPNQGSGLGLAIVARAVERMGGRVRARAGTPQGLVIEIVLPKGDDKRG